MKVILTGAAGFIGSCTLWQLNAMGIDQVFSVDTGSDPTLYPTLKNKKMSDYLTREALLTSIDKNQLNDIDLIIHLGACSDTTERDASFLNRNNLQYSQTLAKWAIGRNIEFHYASSASIYGDGHQGYSDDINEFEKFKGLNLYAESKRLFDKWVIEEKLLNQVVGYRYFNVYGPNEYHKAHMKSMVAKAFDQLNSEGAVKLFASSRDGFENGSEERDFVYIKDVVKVMSYFIEHPDKKGIFNIGTGRARSFKDLITAVFTALKKTPNINWIPMPESLKGQYQYFTQADLNNLIQAGYTTPFEKMEDSVRDFVVNHLAKPDPIL